MSTSAEENDRKLDNKHDSNHDNMEEDDDSKIFPQRLMEILSEEQNQAAISWLPHGRAFVIRDRKLFAETVMPRYFSRKAKYSSFTRKLNRWNFVRVSSGPEIGSYYHEFFLRDKPHLAAQMFCKNARTMLAMASSTEGAPAKPAPASVADVPAVPQINPAAACYGPSLAAGVGMMPTQQSAFGLTPQHCDPNLPSPLLASLKGAPTASNVAAATSGIENASMSDLKGALLSSVPINTLQFLERQMQVLQQQEQANRLIMEQAVALSLQQNHRPNHSPLAINQHARLLQMRQLMEARQRQQKGRVPTNHRASAA